WKTSPIAMLADALLPVPPSVDVTVLVRLVKLPGTLATTFTLNVQDPLAGRVAPARLIVALPATAVGAVPLQDPLTPFGVATNILAGRVSLNATLVRAIPFGLVIVKVKLTGVPTGTATYPKLLLIVAGLTTSNVAVAAVPLPALDAMGPVLFSFEPAVTPMTSML